MTAIAHITGPGDGGQAALGRDACQLERLVALHDERVREERAGKVRWLRPDYQIPRFEGARADLVRRHIETLALMGEVRLETGGRYVGAGVTV